MLGGGRVDECVECTCGERAEPARRGELECAGSQVVERRWLGLELVGLRFRVGRVKARVRVLA